MTGDWHCPTCEVGQHQVGLDPPACWACGQPMLPGHPIIEYGRRNQDALRTERTRP